MRREINNIEIHRNDIFREKYTDIEKERQDKDIRYKIYIMNIKFKYKEEYI